MPTYEGYFQNGDVWNGDEYEENGRRWFMAIDTKTGLQYETEEMPTRYPLFTMHQFMGAWTRQQVEDYIAERMQ